MIQPSAPSLVPHAPHLRRVALRTPTLPPATHTNCYVVGEKDVLLVDPASPFDEEQAALDAWLESQRGPTGGAGLCPTAILLTHHHVDHVSGAEHLRERLGLPVWAHRVTAELLDGRVRVDRFLDEGERLPFGPGGAGLWVLHTPGHAPGHVVLVDEEAGVAIVGDMVASVGTIIIDPPEGDMRLYLASLERLRSLGLRVLLPAHGDPVLDPAALLSYYIAHRLERERRVLLALKDGPGTACELVPRAYPDIAPMLYPLAARSLLAHLLKLEHEGRATRPTEDGPWSAR